MTVEDNQLIRSLQNKIAQLRQLYEAEKNKSAMLAAKLEHEKKELMWSNKKYLELHTKHDNLLVTGMLSATEEDRKRNKAKLDKMVREIDKCLALIKVEHGNV
ncbi:MAG: hypothetical protein LBR81_01275 [Prevotellaceae bacterium]|jgi:hypothetical protein|nr:hypothetical protein [Prevotellaceae bacterium]